MKTDELVAMLARHADAVAPSLLQRRFAVAATGGVLAALLLMLVSMGLRPDMAVAVALPMFWVKLVFPLAVAAGAMVAAVRLSRPGVELGAVPLALAAPVLGLWLLAAVVLLGAPAGDFTQLIFGPSWRSCPFNIALLSLPLFLALLWTMRGFAPTRPAVAGAAAGLSAGAGGALVYALHCTEMAAPFLGIWYVLGILIPATAGAIIGPRWLRW